MELLTEHVIMGLHSFCSIEEKTLQSLVQFGVKMGQKHGNINISEKWTGRRTVACTVVKKFAESERKVQEIIQNAVKMKSIALTTDLWTDNVRKRSYLDVSAVFLTSPEDNELSHTALACKMLPDEAHTGENIRKELESVLVKYGISDDVPITSDSGSNVLKALNNRESYVCFCHRFHTCFSDAMERAASKDEDLEELIAGMRSLQMYLSHTNGINHQLPITIK